ncbi:hypothetical protein MHYP_G00173100 [Metynnis hypsauchen]
MLRRRERTQGSAAVILASLCVERAVLCYFCSIPNAAAAAAARRLAHPNNGEFSAASDRSVPQPGGTAALTPTAAAAAKQLSAVSSAGYGSSWLCAAHPQKLLANPGPAEAGLTVPGCPERITLQQHTGTSGGFPTCCTSSSRADEFQQIFRR